MISEASANLKAATKRVATRKRPHPSVFWPTVATSVRSGRPNIRMTSFSVIPTRISKNGVAGELGVPLHARQRRLEQVTPLLVYELLALERLLIGQPPQPLSLEGGPRLGVQCSPTAGYHI